MGLHYEIWIHTYDLHIGTCQCIRPIPGRNCLEFLATFAPDPDK